MKKSVVVLLVITMLISGQLFAAGAQEGAAEPVKNSNFALESC